AALDAAIQESINATLTAQPTHTLAPTETPVPSDTPLPTETATPEPTATSTATPTDIPTATPTTDVTATVAVQQTAQAALDAAIQESINATLTAQPTHTLTPLPTETPTDTPVPPTATIDATATTAAQQTEQAALDAAIQESINATLTAEPTATLTLLPTETPTATSTDIPTATATTDVTATAAAQQTEQAALDAAIQESINATLTAQPTNTLAPTDTPAPTATETPDLLATALLQTAEAVQISAPTETANYEAQIAAAVESTLTAQPTETPIPSDTLVPTETFTPTPEPTDTPTPRPTNTPSPTVTPSPSPTATHTPSATPEPPTPAITLEPSPAGPTPDLFATATALAVPPATATLDANALTATQIVANATADQAAAYTATAYREEVETAQTATAVAVMAATPDFEATATSAVATATAVAPEPDNLGLFFDVPEGWSAPEQLDAYTLTLAGGDATLFIYRGDSAYFADNDWGIARDETDRVNAAEALAATFDGTLGDYEGRAAIPVLTEPEDDQQGALLITQFGEMEWLLFSFTAPVDDFDTLLAEVIEPLILSVELAPDPAAVPSPTPVPPTATFTPTAVPPTLSAFQQTATAVIHEATLMATLYVPPTVGPTRTPRPTRTPTHTPTFTPSPDFPATATVAVQNVTATAQVATAEAMAIIPFNVPAGWGWPRLTDPATVYLTDDTAQVFITSADAAYFEARWGIPADETGVLQASGAVVQLTGGQKVAYDVLTQMVTIQVADGDDRGMIYLMPRAEDGWTLISVSAPAADFDTYADVFAMLVAAYAGAADEAATPPDPVPATVNPSDVTLTPYRDDALGLAFDAPAGWVESVDETLNEPDMGLYAVIFFASAEDAANADGVPAMPALAVLRFNGAEFLMESGIATPGDLLVQMMDIDREHVLPFDAAEYPAARAVLDEDGMYGAIYALALPDDHWVIMLLVVPPEANVALWDEVVLMPVVRSVALLEDAATDS
ncbi:MAG: hypothetical protein K8S97_11150, partial [Anaerolineae bacterium]|nr:hypothetical protein [Anaerolineae bacterium]